MLIETLWTLLWSLLDAGALTDNDTRSIATLPSIASQTGVSQQTCAVFSYRLQSNNTDELQTIDEP
jgi:hypothetical protein